MELQVLTRDPGVEDAAPTRDHHLFWWSPEIERLHREGRLSEALALAWSRMEAVEHERPLPYGWAWGVAMIARQMRRYDLEVEVAERVLAIAAEGGAPAEPWESRLGEARMLAERVGRP
jgi:hypothetical protein